MGTNIRDAIGDPGLVFGSDQPNQDVSCNCSGFYGAWCIGRQSKVDKFPEIQDPDGVDS